jgi:hypothetical protein
MRSFAVNGTQIGENGINYGNWARFVTAENEAAAKAEAVRIVKAQGGATAHICEATGVRDRGEVKPCDCCGLYH